ncbi:MAG: response regulator transcription factor [Chloroflexi bacterium]|nr:response regulator transcription factor [Chloroflexota bacterium]
MNITREHLSQTESHTYQLRLLVIVLVAFLVYRFFSPSLSFWPPVVVLAGYLSYTIALHYLVLPRYFHPYLVFGIMGADWVLAAVALRVVGVDSPAFLLFPLLVGYHAVYLGIAGSLTSATIASFVSLGLSFERWDPGVVSTVAFRIPLLYIVAAISGYLAQQRSRERDARLALQEALSTEQKASELLGAVQEMHQDPGKMLQDVAAAAVRASGARQAIILLKDPTGHELRGKAAFPREGEGLVKDVASIAEPLAGHWLQRGGPDGSALTLPMEELHDWARSLPSTNVIGIPLVSGEHKLGALYLLINGLAPDESKRIGNSIAPLASASIAEAERYVKAQHEAVGLLRGLRSSVERMGHVREAQSRRPITRGPLTLNPTKDQALVNGNLLNLSSTEFEVLYYLAERAGQTINQATLLHEVWGDEAVAHSNLVDVCIYRLRRKLAQHPGGKDLIVTVRGAGYKIDAH